MNEEIDISEEQAAEAEGAGSEQITTAAEEPAQQTVSEESNVDEKAQSKKAYTPEEQAAYSFRKQLSKQKSKYESQIAEMQKSFEERLARLEHPEQYRPQTREQFQTDDDYIQYLVEQRFNNVWNQRLQEAQQKYQEQQQQDQEVQAYRSRQDENVKKLFKTPEAEQQYRAAIKTALDNGLGELIDSDKEIATYIMRSELGPKLLYEFATKPQEVQKMFDENVTPMDRQFMIRELEGRLRNEMVKPAMPVVGKPGLSTQAKQGSIFDSDDSILNYLRTH